jgi:predicted HTH transcriptional regulator
MLVSAFGVAEQSTDGDGHPVGTARSLIASGESSTVEFTSGVPTERDERGNVARTVAGFANGDGGWILMGVNNAGELVGVRPEDATAAAPDTVTRWISDRVSPLPEFTIATVPLGPTGRERRSS